MRNAGHMMKLVDPGAEKGATETELPAPSVTTDTPKEGIDFEHDQVGGVQGNSQTQAVPLQLTPAHARTAKESPSQEKRNP